MADEPKPNPPAEPAHEDAPEKPFQPLPPNVPLPPDVHAEEHAKEVGGRNGPEPTRYGDWEKGGIAVDF